jgi:hypothetical protein
MKVGGVKRSGGEREDVKRGGVKGSHEKELVLSKGRVEDDRHRFLLP